jgi:hypothetical protein
MKRMVCGAALFLCMAAAGDGSRLLACDDRPASRFHASMFESGENTVVITSDDDIITVVVYSTAEAHSEWM